MSLLSVKNLGKSYRTYRSEWQRFARWFGISVKPHTENWVLRGVGFDIQPGESIGVLGKNGAGKSTLLKMITGTLQPSEGSIILNGRIAAILELGMGFNPELTGRQNVIHAAGLMGYTRDLIDKVMPDIEAFSDVGEYFDQAVRTYSSGMQSRVSFAVATAFKTDILIVDESLAVGDAAFQRKCFRRLESMIEEGTTLLFVSHDIESVKKICKTALYIDKGGVVEFGEAKAVCDIYERALFSKNNIPLIEQVADVGLDLGLKSDCEISYGSGGAVIQDLQIKNAQDGLANVIKNNDVMRLCFKVEFFKSVKSPIFTYLIKTKEGIAISGTDSFFLSEDVGSVESGSIVNVEFSFNASLVPGIYYINCGVRESTGEEVDFLHRRVDAAIFRVVSSSGTTALAGLADFHTAVKLSSLL
ncbi:ABC transporter ATP-binding protein [Pseudomonas chlororaphis]|uniref:ABC transporter ATP-binding protein n=1 Tax=Pseudomonas chlororaphis TaxID=587753 RepID=UPI0039E095A3